MNKKEVLELKRRFKKDAATFTRVCGCYVDGNHNKICKFGNTFLNLEEDEYYKYQMVAENDSWGEPVTEDLDLKKQYFCIKPDKNRAGSKDKIMLFEIDLNLNVWRNIGYIIKRPKNSE